MIVLIIELGVSLESVVKVLVGMGEVKGCVNVFKVLDILIVIDDIYNVNV